jgi:predicted CXXCH cytochrome family protein
MRSRNRSIPQCRPSATSPGKESIPVNGLPRSASKYQLLVLPALVLFSLITAAATTKPTTAISAGQSVSNDPNSACASCHREIYDRYRTTPMANASGLAADGLTSADFRHASSGVHYRVFEQSGQVWLSYHREAATPTSSELDGRQQLIYFLGSGKRGRTYLFQQQGYWFEAPINWYAKKQLWDMPPNYLAAREMPLTLAVDPGCLHCHASGVASALPDARNHYAAAPFAYGGITCSACHGDATAHIASRGKVSLPEIDSMEPLRRDSVCLNCHLEGQAAVIRRGKQLQNFTPGDNLFDYALFFVYGSESGSGGRATSQWEALLKSACKQQSGDRLTCTTCHDPHSSPSPSKRVAFYRQRCLQCHNQAGFQQNHHPGNPDCTSCHMARPPSNDIAHEQVTDHWIKKRVTQERLPLPTSGNLVVVGGFPASDRDLGLAYAQMAARGDRQSGIRALELLRNAEKQDNAEKHDSGASGDHELHAQLAFLDQLNDNTQEAAEEYRKALTADSNDSLAAGNLALIQAGQHHYSEAIRLWDQVFSHDPVQLSAGLNLAVVECGAGQRTAALATLERLLTFSPDNGRAQAMAADIRSGKQSCGTK